MQFLTKGEAMKIPDSIRIAGFDYAVNWEKFIELGGRSCYGMCNSDKNIISMLDSDDVGWQHKCQTFLHECLHGIVFHYGIPLPKKYEEEIVDKLATGFYQLLQDNGRKLFDIKEQGECFAGNDAV